HFDGAGWPVSHRVRVKPDLAGRGLHFGRTRRANPASPAGRRRARTHRACRGDRRLYRTGSADRIVRPHLPDGNVTHRRVFVWYRLHHAVHADQFVDALSVDGGCGIRTDRVFADGGRAHKQRIGGSLCQSHRVAGGADASHGRRLGTVLAVLASLARAGPYNKDLREETVCPLTTEASSCKKTSRPITQAPQRHAPHARRWLPAAPRALATP